MRYDPRTDNARLYEELAFPSVSREISSPRIWEIASNEEASEIWGADLPE